MLRDEGKEANDIRIFSFPFFFFYFYSFLLLRKASRLKATFHLAIFSFLSFSFFFFCSFIYFSLSSPFLRILMARTKQDVCSRVYSKKKKKKSDVSWRVSVTKWKRRAYIGVSPDFSCIFSTIYANRINIIHFFRFLNFSRYLFIQNRISLLCLIILFFFLIVSFFLPFS